MDTLLLSGCRIRMSNTVHWPYGCSADCVQASDSIHTQAAEKEAEKAAWYWGTKRSDWIFSVRLLELALHRLVLQLNTPLLLQPLLHITSYRKNLGVCLQLVGYKQHLNIHPKSLLKSASPLLLVGYHIWCKLTKCNAPVRWVRRRYCDVYTQVRNTLTYIR